MIHDEAVEAAAQFLYNNHGDDDGAFLAEVRAALEAAAPHMMAAAWSAEDLAANDAAVKEHG